MRCDAAFELISAHLDGTNTPAEEAALQAHLSECEECRQLMETMTALELNTRNLQVACPPQLKQNIMAAIEAEAEQKPKKQRPRWVRSVAALGGIAAMLALVLATGAVKLPRRSELAAMPDTVHSEEVLEGEARTFGAFNGTGEVPEAAPEAAMDEAPAQRSGVTSEIPVEIPATAAATEAAPPAEPAGETEYSGSSVIAEAVPEEPVAGIGYATVEEENSDNYDPPRRGRPQDAVHSALDLAFSEELMAEFELPVLVFYNLNTDLTDAMLEAQPELGELLQDAEVLDLEDRSVLELDLDTAYALVEWLQQNFALEEPNEAPTSTHTEDGDFILPDPNAETISEAWARIQDYDPNGECLSSLVAPKAGQSMRIFPSCFNELLTEGFLWDLLYPENYEPAPGDHILIVLQAAD